MNDTTTPESPAAVADWVKSRLASGEPFRVCGGGTRSTVGDGSLLSVARLGAIRFLEPDDMVVGVDAGVTIAELQDALAERGMVLPINPWFEGATVGGMVASNEFGPDRLERGGLRDFIIGIEYVNGEGNLVKAGGKVVKNVTGYDLGKMMLGSLGGLGVITGVNFKVVPRPIDPALALITQSDTGWVKRLLELHQSKLPLDWLQVVHQDACWTVAVGFSGNPERRRRIGGELEKCLGNGLEVRALRDEPDGSPWGRLRHRGFLTPYAPGSALHLHATMPTRALLDREDPAAWTEGARRVVMHPIGGDLHCFYAQPDTAPVDAIRSRVERAGGFVHVEGSDAWTLPASHALARHLKRTLDPNDIFLSPYYARAT